MKKIVLSVIALLIFIIPSVAQTVKDSTLHNQAAPKAKDSVVRKKIVRVFKDSALRNQIAQIAKPVKGIVGVAILNMETGDTLSRNGKAQLVLHSVMKFPIALTVLHWVDTGKLTLDQTVHLSKRNLAKPGMYSPLRDKYPKGDVDISIRDLLNFMITQSDNTACDILLEQIKGPQTVQAYLLQLGVRGIAVRTSEADMASAWELQYTNWAKPIEMTVLLNMFYNGKILTKESTDLLYTMMTETTTGPKRLKGLLPEGTVVAHKTGTSPTSADGLTPATNDVGIITLPNGKHLVISVFVCSSTNDEATREGTIAKIAKAAYDYYNH